MVALTPISDLAFSHKGIDCDNFSVMIFQGIVFLQMIPLIKFNFDRSNNENHKIFQKLQLLRLKLSAVGLFYGKSYNVCIEKTEEKTCKHFRKSKISFFLFVLFISFDLMTEMGIPSLKMTFKMSMNTNALASF